MGDQKIHTHVLTILDCEVQMEVKRMRVTMKSSVLWASTPEALASFDWSQSLSPMLPASSVCGELSAIVVNVLPSKVRKNPTVLSKAKSLVFVQQFCVIEISQ